MKHVNIPKGYQQIMPYIIINNAADFLEFTKTVFKAEELYKEMKDKDNIKHAEVKIGKSVIMFADSNSEYQPQTAGMFVYVDDIDKVYKKALQEGSTSVSEPVDQSYGRSAGIKDPFGNTWWITSGI